MPEQHEVVVIGAGWAGLSVGYKLRQAGIDHVIFERNRVCETWRTQRWDSFRMNTPNLLTVLPGDDGFLIQSSTGLVRADYIVVATGNLNVPKWPDLANRFPVSVEQIDGTEYRSAAALLPGAVLVIGCGNTGGQIAEELVREGRRVFLSTGRNGRVPRTYRGRDIFLWLTDNGRMGKPRTTESGRGLIGATHTISLQSLSAQGAVLLGRFKDCTRQGRLSFDDSLDDCAAYGDEMSAMLRQEIDAYIFRTAIDAGEAVPDPAETVAEQFPDPPISEIDLSTEGITTVIWAVGLRGDFGWLKVPGALDAKGNPVEEGCVSVPGVYFAGLDSPASLRAGTVLSASKDATRISDHIVESRACGRSRYSGTKR